jgi:hypothetical protein
LTRQSKANALFFNCPVSHCYSHTCLQEERGWDGVVQLSPFYYLCWALLRWRMNYLRSRSLKRLLSLGRRSNADESVAEECLVDAEPPPPNKPTWRCFSYDELHQATNGFHQGN